MGISINSHGKKSDKETQSPLLKIFKEIMMRENNDPERRNLLDQKEDRKRRQYNGSKPKIERRSESNSSVHRKRSPYKFVAEQRNAEIGRGAQSGVFHSDKKDSWWNWNRIKNAQNESADDTCSCGSCALKRIVNSEYACIGCLVLIFCISIVLACLLVFKNIPTVATECPPKITSIKPCLGSQEAVPMSDSDRLKRKIEMINENRKNELNEGVFGKPQLDDIQSDPVAVPGSAELDFGPSLRELNGFEDSESRSLGDMEFSPLEPEKIEMHSSDKLKEFYTKLVQTDAKIKTLKKMMSENNINNNVFDGRTPDKTKRSLKLYYPNQGLRRKRQVYPSDSSKYQTKRKGKMKRFSNASDDSTGFVIEKKKLIVQYRPSFGGKKLVAKCSHSPKDAHAHQHEHQLKHPFYQNTQRLDELLDRFLNKNLPEIISDPFGLDFLFKPKKEKCKHPKPTMNVDIISSTEAETVTKKKEESPTTTMTANTKIFTTDSNTLFDEKKFYSDMKLINYSNNGYTQIPKPKMKAKKLKEKHKKLSTTLIKPAPDIMKLLRPESTTVYESDFNEHRAQMISKEKLKFVTSSPSNFEVLLSVSTIMNPKIKKAAAPTDSFLLDQPPNLRRLMQLEGEEEENLGYEDFKEVLTDEMDNQDEVDRRGDRKKRNEVERITVEAQPAITTVAQDIPAIPEKAVKYNPPGVQNPNWKGPMPLYPDEINSMIKHAAMTANKPLGSVPEEKEVLTAPTNRQRRDLTDVEYVEDYLDNKFDKLVEMAQAYSDYGVLEGKKDTVRNEKNPATDNISVDNRVKLSVDGALKRRGVFGRQKKEQYGTFTISHRNGKTSQSSEGIRFEMHPTTETKLADIDLYKFLSSHFRIDSGENKKNIEKPSKLHSMQISVYPNFNIPYTPKVDMSIYTKPQKEYSNTEEMVDMTNNFAVSKGRTLLSTLYKISDYNDNDDIQRTMVNSNKDIIQNNKHKRETQEDKENNLQQLKNANLDQYENGNSAETVCEDNTVKAGATQELDTYYISQATKHYIDVYKYPFANSGQQEAPTELPDNTISAVIIPKPNATTKVDDSIIILASDEIPYSTMEPKYSTSGIGVSEPSSTKVDTADQENLAEFDNISKILFESPLDPNNLVDLEKKVNNITNESEFEQKKTIDTDNVIKIEDNLNTDVKFKSNETLVTIQRCEMRPKDIGETKYAGQIILKLESPEFGVENIALNFDTSLFVDAIESDSESQESISPENRSDITSEDNVTATPTLPGSLMASVSSNRSKRDNADEKLHDKAAKSNVTKSNAKVQNKKELDKNLLLNNTNLYANTSLNSNVTLKANHSASDNITLSEFFMMISDWFKTLEGIKEQRDKARNEPISDIAVLLKDFNNIVNKTVKKSVSTEPAYPNYDSDMIENIGHRSRVLLSVKESNITEGEDGNETEDIKVTTVKSANVSVNANSTTASTSTTQLIVNITTPEKDRHTATNTPKKDSDKRKVKRNADDSNLILWNDIYDDEYGIQADNLDGVIRDKMYVKDNDFIKRSGRWVQDKIKKFAENLKSRDQMVSIKSRLPRAAKRIEEYPRYVSNKIHEKVQTRSANDQEDDDSEHISVFNTLGANMVEVCKKAAIAVKQTSNSEVKEDAMQSSVATSLMQQLVRLLTDLVDYQVQVKTCAKLPPDLKSFLEWLTYPDEETIGTEREPDAETVTSNYKTTLPYPEEDVIDELVNAEHGSDFGTTMMPMDGMREHEKMDYKTQYLDALRSVQDLLDQFEEMSDDDKSKMTGVKFYLQNQLRYLNKQFTGYDMYNLFDKHGMPLLYKREVPPNEIKTPNLRHKRKLYKFVKNFGKKHTRTTASFYDGMVPVTEMKETKDVFDSRIEGHTREEKLKPTDSKNMKRNLKDVYYKAIAEAKKYATGKSGHKKQNNVEFSTTKNKK